MRILPLLILMFFYGIFAQTEKPNIIFIYADQLRSSAMGAMGNDYIKTPNLDTLANQGVLFKNAYVATPVCTPYRAQLMTGKYGHANGVLYNDLRLPLEEITIAEVVKGQGYVTGYIGKWHLDGGRKSSDPLELAGYVRSQNRQGFDYWAAIEVTHDYIDWNYYTGNSETKIIEKGWETDLQTDKAIQYIGQRKDSTFLLVMAWGTPHNWCCSLDGNMPAGAYRSPDDFQGWHEPNLIPLRPNVPTNLETTARTQIAGYYDMVSNLDQNMGRMMKALDSLGITNNTILAFGSDHGDMLSSHGRKHKQVPYEESAHVPFILNHPGGGLINVNTNLLFTSVDIMPTLLGLAGISIPQGVQGADHSLFLKGQTKNQPEAIYFSLNDNEMVPSDGGFIKNWVGVRTQDWLYTADNNGDWMLFDLKNDPYQMSNLANNSQYETVKNNLRSLTLNKKNQYQDPFAIDYGNFAAPEIGCQDSNSLNYNPQSTYEFENSCHYAACCGDSRYNEYTSSCKNNVESVCLNLLDINEIEAHENFKIDFKKNNKVIVNINSTLAFEIKVYDIRGNIYNRIKGIGPVAEQIILRDKGVYFLNLTTPNKNTIKKIVTY